MTTTRTARARRTVSLLFLLGCSSAIVWGATKGPDGGGYSATDETVYSFVDISGASGGTRILSGVDDGTAVLALPFGFRFYGQPYTLACVSANGALYFIAAASACTGFDADFANTDLTAAAVPNDRPAILPFWSDLTFQVAGAGGVFYQTIGAAPTRRFVVQWHNAYPQGSPTPVTFQAILHEGGNQVRFQYQTVALGGHPARNGARATIGIRNSASPGNNQQLQWSFNAPVLADASALVFAGGDSEAPTLTASASPSSLWPPSNKPVPVTVSGAIADTGSGVDPTSARYAVSDEYGVVQPTGAIAVAADGRYEVQIPLVASRNGSDRDGRVYSILISAKDHAGNTASATLTVIVPHDQR